MAERKSGPVKPPVIDLTARDTTPPPDEGARPETADAGVVEHAESERDGVSSAEAAQRGGTAEETAAAEAGEQPSRADAEADPELPPMAASAAADEPFQSAPPPGPRPERRRPIWPAVLGGSLGGAVLGTALTYAMMTYGYFPPPQQQADPQLEALSERLAALEAAPAPSPTEPVDLEPVNQRIASVQNELGQRIEALDSALAQQASQLQSAATAPAEVDLSPLQTQINELRSQLAAQPQPADPADTEALTQSVAQLQQSVSALQEQVGSIDTRSDSNTAEAVAVTGQLTELQQGLEDLRNQFAALDTRTAQSETTLQNATAELASTQTRLAELSESAASASSPVLQLPLVLSGLEDALDNGRPYAAEIESIRSILPEQDVPLPVMERAQAGLVPPEVLNQRFDEVLPEMVAATPPDPDAGPLQSTLDWGKSLLALRPAQEIPGNSPEAVVSRLEGAMARRDYVGASELFAQLPDPMRAQAGELQAELEAQAAARRFISDLRANALAQRQEPTP